MAKGKSGPSVSASMKKGIKACERILGVKYSGKTFDDAKKFLDENLEKIKDKDMRDYMEPSEKMWKGIGFITQMTGLEFTGSTMKEASEFIARNLDKAKAMAEKRKK